MLLLIDNYDSFTYNLYQYLAELGADVLVRRNDEITVEEAEALAPERIVISPGPCTPREAGVSNALIARLGPRVPLLGVCLGHQCIGEVFGGRVIRAPLPVHGKTARISHGGAGVFRGLPNPFEATRYHSLVVERETLPPELEITAETADGLIMGLRHRAYPVQGVQFHPESILTAAGKDLLRNFLEDERSKHSKPLCGETQASPPLRPQSASGPSMTEAAHPVEQLFALLEHVAPYPSGVTPVPDRIQGVAFFPGGSGLWSARLGEPLPPMPMGGVMVLGHNFDSVAGFQRSLASDGENMNGATWRNLLHLLDHAGIPKELCFFTNVYMGLIDGPSALGPFPGAKDLEFVHRCSLFLAEQVRAMQPRLILALGKEVPRMLLELSTDLRRGWAGARTLTQLDLRGSALMYPVTFAGVTHPVAVVALTHPALRYANVGRRRFGSLEGNEAEVALIHQAMRLAGLDAKRAVDSEYLPRKFS